VLAAAALLALITPECRNDQGTPPIAAGVS